MLLRHARSLLFLPASNPRAIAKARTLPCDMVILDLEDAVPEDRKGDALDGALAALTQGFGGRLSAVRINVEGAATHGREMIGLKGTAANYVVLPKVEHPKQVKDVFSVTQKPVIAMIESARGVLAANAIAAGEGCAGLFMGNNALRRDLAIPDQAGRAGLSLAMQTVVLAARAAGIAVFDGVFNRLEDETGLEAECAEGHALGFDGKTLIHPAQVRNNYVYSHLFKLVTDIEAHKIIKLVPLSSNCQQRKQAQNRRYFQKGPAGENKKTSR